MIVAPITHTPPVPPAEGIEVPPRVKAHLGLDAQRPWIIVSDLNRFTWPGFDLYPALGYRDRYDYGFLPPSLFRLVRDRVLALNAMLRKTTSRD